MGAKVTWLDFFTKNPVNHLAMYDLRVEQVATKFPIIIWYIWSTDVQLIFVPHEQYYLAGLDVICDEIKQKTQAIGMLDHVGKAFIEALKHTDLDPIYFCEAGVCV